MPRALISVYNKAGIDMFAGALTHEIGGWEILSTGGTARFLREKGIPVTDVSEVTGHPEMMDGRIKTLHPAVHAGLLARRALEEDMDALVEHGYSLIDMVVVNLYPFEKTAAAGAPFDEVIEQIDIGGPAMLRSAAKNHSHVWAVVDPADYIQVFKAIRDCENTKSMRGQLAAKVYAHLSAYDAAIASYLVEHYGVGLVDRLVRVAALND